jgi:carbonic anhydrase
MKPLPTPTRRDFLTTGLLGAAAVLTPSRAAALLADSGAEHIPSTSALPEPEARHPLVPSDALARLREGNARVVEGRPTGPNRGLDRVAAVAPSQAPFAAILGCADSRVPPELLFDQGYGDLFVVRVAGNVATPEELASLEFAVAALGSTLIMVLGHADCGAVKAAMGSDVPPGQISGLFQHITPSLPNGETDVAAAVEANTRHQMEVVRRGSPLLAQAMAEGRLGLAAAVYDLGTGRVRVLDTVGV